MTYSEDDYLMISGIQHFKFCRRQWALIHVEQQWAENVHTVVGELMHKKAHDPYLAEKRKDILVSRALPIFSHNLGIRGECDVVEFHAAPNGIELHGEMGRWLPYPVEYKRGAPKQHDADALQLCAQAMCLEEMLCCSIPEGALFYGETRRRTLIAVTEELRQRVCTMLEEMHMLYAKGHTPRVKPTKACNACSLKEACLPALMRGKNVQAYLRQALEEETP